MPNSKHERINNFIENTLLKPDTTFLQVEKLCQESIQYRFHGVCVNSMFVPLCRDLLDNSTVKVVTVVGFPLGAMSTAGKSHETSRAVLDGAREIDMVLPIGALKSHKEDYIINDIATVVEAAGKSKVKVIIETALLTEKEKIRACELVLRGGAHFVKTCTGFSGGAANIEDITLIKSIVGDKVGIKASGGIKTFQQAQALIEAGATRIGTSSGVDIVLGKKSSPLVGDY